MARFKVPITVLDASGNALAGASVLVKIRASGTNATVYTAESGGTSSTGAVTTDANGRVPYWVDSNNAYSADISGTGITAYTEYFDARQGVISPFLQSHGFSLAGNVIVPANNTTDVAVVPGKFMDFAAGETVTIVKVRYKIHSGTSATFKFQKAGSDITPWPTSGTASITATTSGATQTLAAPATVSAGEYLQLIVTAISGTPTGLAVTLFTSHIPPS
jgi:hypothetical protein